MADQVAQLPWIEVGRVHWAVINVADLSVFANKIEHNIIN